MWRGVSIVSLLRRATTLMVLGHALIASGTAGAVTFDLDTEFDTGATGPFATVGISENAGALDFSISLDIDELGPDADLHAFYFNFVGDDTGLAISNTNAPNTEYLLGANPSVDGGAGSSFDWGVDFGDGAGSPGNGELLTALFSLTADQALTIQNLLGSSFASGDTIEVHMAAHIQGTSALTGATSETIGGLVPEPSTGLLVLSGLAMLAVRGNLAGSSRGARR